MTRQGRLLLSALLVGWVGMLLACGGVGPNPGTTTPIADDNPAVAAPLEAKPVDDLPVATSKAATKEAAKPPSPDERARSAREALVNQCVGRWRIEATEGAFLMTLTSSFDAQKTNDLSATGKWELAGKDARVVWSDGWRNILQPEKGISTAFRPGTSWTDPPTSIVRAIKESVPPLSSAELLQAAQVAEAKRKAEEEYDANGLVLLLKTIHYSRDEFSLQIMGTIVNRRGRELKYAQVTFKLFDKDGGQVGTAIANINDLEPGGKWNFKAVGIGRDFSSCKVSDLSGF